ncbi:sigma-70 family RNA polymerase sigma factor [Arthrobacter sp. AK01]|uniref:sigma-70 family RNA polymerase sigma factor n=1 Tax=Micrococcaceae TaxID=1268 RepID=UPI001E62C70E|nr:MULTISPECIES: sigma-70 family RNA polymerase sigma factor [Micrococcaceae]MCD4852221.1 sigma-70 family RNA polymerase sigma factor [Arthrobacter sp. AK01]MCP1412455.1 RNA polymerase sigma factor (sigma-70 family) [Paenarthrobacter sp. A20]
MAHRSQSGSNVGVDVESDGHLIELVRGGEVSAFNGLYERHVSIASTVARRNVDNPSDVEDVVAEAFQSVLQSLVAGKGPDTFFRAYLLSTVTRLSHQRNRKAGKVLPSGDDSVLDQTLTDSDAAVNAFESHAVAKAFRALPERWQAVLWYLDVERMKPAVVAPILGLSANAVSALALRAREGLRREYLQSHIANQPDSGCVEYVSKLGTFLRGGLSSAAERKVRNHLHGCSKCTAALSELKDVQGSMRAVVLPLVTGIPLAAWAGKGAGLGVLGGVVPVKAALVVPTLAQPAVMAIIAAAGVGLVLGAVGIVDQLTPDAYMDQRAVETVATQLPQNPGTLTPTPTPTPSSPPAEAPATPPPVAAAPPTPLPEPSQGPAQTPDPLPSPVTTAAPTPTAVPSTPAPTDISGSVRRDRDGRSSGTPLEIDFKVAGTRPLSSGKAVFSVSQNAWLVEDSVRAPDGWTCAMESSSVLSCTTESVQRDDLHFHIEAGHKRSRDDQVLTYTLSGPGIASNDFSYNF